jgi:glycosyltransferase involved in cell wall biosynthesis
MISAPNGLVSVVMPCHNCAAHVVASVGSVQAQGHADWELLVIDDGSTDESWHVLQSLAARDARIRPLRQANAGAAAARNHGIRQAGGGFMAFLDADDTWHPEFLEAMMAALKANPGGEIAYCGWQNLGVEPGQGEPYIPPDYESADKAESFLSDCPWPIHAALTPTRLVREAGGFDEALNSCMDFDLWLRIATIHRVVRVPRVLAYYHHHGGVQITRNLARIALNHLRVQEKFLRDNPSVRALLGHELTGRLTNGKLLKKGYTCYWKRDLPAARAIFRKLLSRGHGRPRDWLYMLPCLLPLKWHKTLIRVLDRDPDPTP